MKCPKPLKVIDPKYKYWLVENKPCLMSGMPAEAGHHLPNHSGKKRSRDDQQIPLTSNWHMYYHAHPEEERKMLGFFYEKAKEFWEEYQRTKK